jgi:hypothetical protein
MPTYQLTKDDLIYRLKEQLYFIDSPLANFSSHIQISTYKNKQIGKLPEANIFSEIESKRIATAIRVLVHDTNNSKSLLHSLGIKENIKYIDSSRPDDGRLHSMTGMKGVIGSPADAYLGLVAKINTENKTIAAPLYMQHLKEWYVSYSQKKFSDWWTGRVYSHKDNAYSRRDLILFLANKDGGAHVDPEQPQGYQAAKETKLELTIYSVRTEFERNVVFATVAQIGWELLNSINESDLSINS